MNWSHYQEAIFDAVAHSDDSLLIEALAGSGKTSTIVEAIRYVPEGKSICLLAFNKRIAEELQQRVQRPGARCMTLHAAGWAAWRRAVSLEGACQVESRKTGLILDDLVESRQLTERDRWRYSGQMGKLISLAKGAGIVPENTGTLTPCNPHPSMCAGLAPDTDETWLDLIDHYGLDAEEVSLDLARKVLAESIARGKDQADFDDMQYLPLVHGVPFEQYDVVFVDESQDVAPIQLEMLSRMARRVISVGDENQAIYGFRGAHSDAMRLIQQRFNCKPLPLSISYRCPKAVVLHARQWVPQIEYAENAKDGYVGEAGTDWQQICLCGHPLDSHDDQKCGGELCGCLSFVPEGVNRGSGPVDNSVDSVDIPSTQVDGVSKFRGALEDFHAGDAILCRVNRPLVALAFRLIRARVPAKVLGRDIGQGLVALVKKLCGKSSCDLKELQVRIDRYRMKETDRLTRRKEYAAVGVLEDKLGTLETFMGEVDSVGELLREIEGLFGEDVQGVVLSSVHKSKGLEFERVFILDAHEHMPSPWAKQAWEQVQERNLQYVAATRAKVELRYISSDEITGG